MGKTYRVRCKELNNNYNGVFVFNNSKFEAPGLLPGELAEVELCYGKDKGKAVVKNIVEPSADRVEPVCPVYSRCGGCKLMHMRYDLQLSLKENYVRSLLSKFGKVGKIVPSDEPFNYRNKIHVTFKQGKKGEIMAGLYEEASHRVINVDACAIERSQAAEITKTIKKFMAKYKIKAYDEDRETGLIRHVLYRVAGNGDTLVAIVIGNNMFPEKGKLAKEIVEKHPYVKTVVLNYNNKKTSMVLGDREEVLVGKGYVLDNMCGLSFRISSKSFYQVNTAQAERIYLDAVKGAQIGSEDTVLDAYCGIGTIGSVVAKTTEAKKVVGVELNKTAVKDAASNARANDISNISFIDGDAGKYLLSAVEAGDAYSCVIMDPPRTGASRDFLKAVVTMAPEKLVYISCNPETLARDLEYLTKKYKVTSITPYDMFSQGGHVECIACIQRVKDKND